MGNLLSTFSAVDILIILLVCLPYLGKFIKAIWNTYKEVKQRRQDLVAQVRAEVEAELQIKARFEEGEERISKLEEDEKSILARLQKNEDQLDLLTNSDMLQIKRDIKKQYDKAMMMKFISGETLDILEQEFIIYEKEGGNSWAKRMMEEMRKLPTVSSLDIDMH